MRQLSCRDVWDRDGGTVRLYVLQFRDVWDWDRQDARLCMLELRHRDVRVCHGAGAVYELQLWLLQFWFRGQYVHTLLLWGVCYGDWDDSGVHLFSLYCRHL